MAERISGEEQAIRSRITLGRGPDDIGNLACLQAAGSNLPDQKVAAREFRLLQM